METAEPYTVSELSELGGVSRRTVRFYVQEGLIPPPHRRGRGATYGPEHLEALLRVKALQESGLKLDDIRSERSARKPRRLSFDPERELWTRIVLGPGIELHVQRGNRIPTSTRLSELADWCRLYIREKEHDDA